MFGRFVLTVLVALCLDQQAWSINEDDLVTSLPNITFRYDFKQYSGYLNANSAGTWRLFYWLTESMQNPTTDPLIIWFNGGPGCSSMSGLLAEYGPFHMNQNGSSLYENVYSWNKHYNLLFVDSPVGTGFSYNTENPTEYTVGDDESAQQNFHALIDLFTRVQPKLRNNTWILAGESYAGIYITTLTNLVLSAIQLDVFPNSNFQGVAIGNGYLNAKNLTNALLHWHYAHGSIGLRQWQDIRQLCCNNVEPIESCDFASHIVENQTDTWALDECGELFVNSLTMPENQNAYNYYLDCYKPDQGVKHRSLPDSKLKHVLQTANLLNYDFTDNQLGYNCWGDNAAKQYLNQKEVQTALHIANDWRQHPNTAWEVCNDELNEHYTAKYTDTFDLFKLIFQRVQKLKHKLPDNFRMLIFNGDVDTVCNFLGDAWHMDNVARQNGLESSARIAWKFRDQIAGYVQRYTKQLSNTSAMSIDVMTVKGAGHFVSDRPGPALQAIVNFVRGFANYSSDYGIDTMPLTHDLVVVEATIESAVSSTKQIPPVWAQLLVGLSLVVSRI